MIWVLFVLLVISLAVNAGLAWVVFNLTQKFESHVDLSEDFAQQLVDTSEEYVRALDDVANKDIFMNDPVIFRLVEHSRTYRDFLVGMTRVLLENREQENEQ